MARGGIRLVHQVLKMTEFLAVPLAYPRSGYAPSASYFRSRGYTTYCAFPQAGTGTKIITKYPLAEMQYFCCISASGIVGAGEYSREGEIKNFHLHLRSRGRCTEIITKSPLAGM